MVFEFFSILILLHIISAIFVLAVVYFAYKLYLETDKGWYWLSLLLSAFLFALSQWTIVLIPLGINFRIVPIISELIEIFAVLLFALSCYGMYKAMIQIRRRLE